MVTSPGEQLPEFPKPTHFDPQERRHPQWTTVNTAISDIPAGTSLHNLATVPRVLCPPYDGNKPLKNTICCTDNQGQGHHPSGQRKFTLREVACLQGFPLEHEFGNLRVRKQIGNAVPPLVAKAFYEQIIRSLRKADGL